MSTEKRRSLERPYVPPRAPSFLSNPTPESILTLLHNSEDLRTALVLKHALEWAVVHADTTLLGWLMSLDTEWAATLDQQAALLEDEDGWGLVGMAIMGSCGREEREEGVRAIVARWGLEAGPNGGNDHSGWTPLHLASLLSTPPLVSFLLTRGASTRATTHRGLNSLDLISGIPSRLETAVLLEHAHSAELDSPGPSNGQPSTSLPDAGTLRRRELLLRRRTRAKRRLERTERQQVRKALALEKEAWVRERARVLDVDPALLLPPRVPRKSGRVSGDSGLGWGGNALDDAESESETSEEEASEEEQDVHTEAYDSLLVWSLPSLPSFLNVLISTYTPNCFPVDRRTLPANALFLAAKFALYRCNDSWLEELLEGAVEKIEKGIYANTEDLAYLAFWAYNSTVLLHLLQGEAELGAACEELGLLGMVEELINAVHVFVIRVAERRIDSVLDAALLDHETIDEFDDVRFEGEWSLFRSFTGAKSKKRGTILPKASQLFGVGDSPGPSSEVGTPPSSSFASLRDAASAASPFGSLRSATRPQSTPDAKVLSTEPSTPTSLMLASEQVTPQSITDILSAVLLVLQLYQVNPAIIVQAFSQVFYWISCEIFNRILTRKKYLCRTKAVQIKMNITALEDWVRFNALPFKIATKHLEPVTQLLAWLQCQSQLHEFDSLIGTLQSMKALNPLQMRRVVRDYRYEVNEARMSDECSQYLSQLQKDWERREVEAGIQEIQREMQAKARRERSDESQLSTSQDDCTSIDSLFDGVSSLADFIPQSSPDCRGELRDSRFMIPFELPSSNEFLVAAPPSSTAFDNTLPQSPFVSDKQSGSRPPSRTSFTLERPLGWQLPNPRKLRELPPDFFVWLKRKQADLRRQRPDPPTAVERPVASPVKIIPPATSARSSLNAHPLRTVSEDDDATTPLAREGGSYFARSPKSASSPTSSRPRQPSLQDSPVHVFAEASHPPRHARTDSYEVQLRQIAAAHLALHSPRDNGGLSPTADKRRWFGQTRTVPGERRLREGSEDTIRDVKMDTSP